MRDGRNYGMSQKVVHLLLKEIKCEASSKAIVLKKIFFVIIRNLKSLQPLPPTVSASLKAFC